MTPISTQGHLGKTAKWSLLLTLTSFWLGEKDLNHPRVPGSIKETRFRQLPFYKMEIRELFLGYASGVGYRGYKGREDIADPKAPQ